MKDGMTNWDTVFVEIEKKLAASRRITLWKFFFGDIYDKNVII